MKHFALTLVLLFWGMSVFSQIDVTQNISCHDGSDGELTVTTTLINAPYTYVWSRNGIPIPSQTQKVASGLDAALYSVTITDATLATETFTYTLENPPAITAVYAIVPNSNWPAPNGRITITANGGSGWFTYQVIDSTTTEVTTQTNNVFDNRYSGTYFITITDVNACQRQDTVVVNETAGIVTTFDIDSTACYRSTAPISDVIPILIPANLPAQVQFPDDTITIIGLLPGPRPYRTSTLDTLASFSSDIHPGRNIFKVVTNDNKGFRHSWVVLEPNNPISITYNNLENIVCYGGNTGTFSTLAQGSYGDFTYSITGPNGFSSNNSNVSDLFAGVYTVIVRDSCDCELEQSVSIIQPDEALRIHFGTETTYCPESEDGKAWISYVENGVSPITQTWETGETTYLIDSLAKGWYTATVTDANGCIQTDSTEIIAGDGVCIPNLVTPNGDGYNDVLDVGSLCNNASSIVLVIQNKDGEIFTSTDPSQTIWDAKNKNGNLIPSGSLVYLYLKIVKQDGSERSYWKTITILY